MIRPITCVAALLACVSGSYVYQVTHQASLLDQQIQQTAHRIAATDERIRMLHAEWTVLNRPDRLQSLADQYLSLQPTQPSQFVSLADLAGRLPPVAPPPAPVVATDTGTAAPVPADAAGPGAAGLGAAGPGGAAGQDGVGGAVAMSGGVADQQPGASGTVASAGLAPAAGTAHVPAAPETPPRAVRVAVVSGVVPRPVPGPLADPPRAAAHAAADRAAGRAPGRPRPTTAALLHPRPWAPSRPAPVRVVAAGYRTPAYRPPPRQAAGGSMLGMAHGYATGPLAPPAPLPMPTALPVPGGGG